MDNYIEIKNITKTYNKTLALDDLTLSLSKGKVYGLLGPNGSGKTTTSTVLTRHIVGPALRIGGIQKTRNLLFENPSLP